MTHSRHAGTAIPGSFRNDPKALQVRASKPQGHSRHVQFSDRAGHGSSRSRLGSRDARATSRRTVLAGVVDEEEFSSIAQRRTARRTFVASLSEMVPNVSPRTTISEQSAIIRSTSMLYAFLITGSLAAKRAAGRRFIANTAKNAAHNSLWSHYPRWNEPVPRRRTAR